MPGHQSKRFLKLEKLSAMNVIATEFKDLYILEPHILRDDRGFFFESYNTKSLLKDGLDLTFVQDNQSHSKKGVMRGLHFQRAPHAQTKLVRALSGVIQDVVVDLRKDQPTFKKVFQLSFQQKTRNSFGFQRDLLMAFLYLAILLM